MMLQTSYKHAQMRALLHLLRFPVMSMSGKKYVQQSLTYTAPSYTVPLIIMDPILPQINDIHAIFDVH